MRLFGDSEVGAGVLVVELENVVVQVVLWSVHSPLDARSAVKDAMMAKI